MIQQMHFSFAMRIAMNRDPFPVAAQRSGVFVALRVGTSRGPGAASQTRRTATGPRSQHVAERIELRCN